MNHTKEPWEITNTGHGGIGIIEGDNHIFVAEVDGRTAQEIMANTSRIVACAGITKEALDKGVINFALDWILKHDILDVFDPNMPREKEISKKEATFMGVRIWEKEASDVQ
jgi:hypothetical protein